MDKHELLKLVEDGLTQQEIADKYDRPKTTVVYWLKKYELKTTTKRRGTSIVWTISKDDLVDIVKGSDSFAEILRKLGYDKHLASTLYTPLKKRLKEDDIDITHIRLGVNSNKGRVFKTTTRKHTKESFLKLLETCDRLHSDLKKKFITFDIIPHDCCAICKQSRVWNNKPLTLQLDHIDGNSKHNLPSNLRFICPNCHTQTETFCIGNRTIKDKNTCDTCDIEISGKAECCQKCASKVVGESQRKFNPTKEELYKLVCEDKLTFTKLGDIYNVSDNAVRKRCLRFGIDPKTRKLLPA